MKHAIQRTTYQSATFLYANYDKTHSHNETPVHALEKAMSLLFSRVTDKL